MAGPQLDPGAAARPRPQPGRCARLGRARSADEQRPGQRGGDVSLRGRDDRSDRGGGETDVAGDDAGRHGGSSLRPSGSAASGRTIPGLLGRGRDLRDHARPLRRRRSRQRRPSPVEGALRPREEALLPWRGPEGHHRPPALPEGPRCDGAVADSGLRQQRPAEREGAARRRAHHGLPRVRRGRLLRRRRAPGRPRDATRAGRGCPPRGDQGHPGPGGQSHRPVPSVGRRPPYAHLVPRQRRAPSRRDVADVDDRRSPRAARAARVHARRLVREHPSRPEPGRPRGRALPGPERALVGGHDGPRRHPPGHAALRPAAVLAGLVSGPSPRVSPAPDRGRDVGRRSRPGVLLPGRRAPLRRHRLRHRHALRFSALLSRAPGVRGREAAEGSGDDARPRSSVSRRARSADVRGQSRHAALHERAGGERRRPAPGLHVPAHRPRPADDLRRRRDRDAGRGRSRQPP